MRRAEFLSALAGLPAALTAVTEVEPDPDTVLVIEVGGNPTMAAMQDAHRMLQEVLGDTPFVLSAHPLRFTEVDGTEARRLERVEVEEREERLARLLEPHDSDTAIPVTVGHGGGNGVAGVWWIDPGDQ